MWELNDYADACAMFRHYARVLAAAAQAKAKADPNLPAILEACSRLETTSLARIEAEGARLAAAETARVSSRVALPTRLLLLLAALLYCAYAWRLAEVRAWLRLPQQPHASSMDALNKGLASVLLGYVLVMAVTGRRLAGA
jgi:hypothetical protein